MAAFAVMASQSPRCLLRPGGLAVSLVQDALSSVVHGGCTGQLGRVLQPARLPDGSP